MTITKHDRKRLTPHLSHWKHLNEILILNGVSNEDLKKLAIIEATTGKHRKVILGKLVGRLMARERRAMLRQLEGLQCAKAN
jgi:hypothetical protein